MRELMIFEL